jgi:hypothetical protein
MSPRGHRIGGFWLLGRRLGAMAGLRTVWEAMEPVACVQCGEEIRAGERYTWQSAGRPICYGCRPWSLWRPPWPTRRGE